MPSISWTSQSDWSKWPQALTWTVLLCMSEVMFVSMCYTNCLFIFYVFICLVLVSRRQIVTRVDNKEIFYSIRFYYLFNECGLSQVSFSWSTLFQYRLLEYCLLNLWEWIVRKTLWWIFSFYLWLWWLNALFIECGHTVRHMWTHTLYTLGGAQCQFDELNLICWSNVKEKDVEVCVRACSIFLNNWKSWGTSFVHYFLCFVLFFLHHSVALQ